MSGDQDPTAFLRSEKTQSSEVLYDAKKWLWIPDETAGFVAGQIKKQDGDKIVLELTNGSVCNNLTSRIGYYS